MKLYDIAEELVALKELMATEEFDNETGELIDNQQAIQELFYEIQIDFVKKMESSAYVIDELSIVSKALKDEATRLTGRAKHLDKSVDYLKNLMLDTLLNMPEKKLKTTRFTFSTRKSQGVFIDKNFDLNGDYVRVKETREPDKTAIKKALQDGEDITGAILEDRINLSIK